MHYINTSLPIHTLRSAVLLDHCKLTKAKFECFMRAGVLLPSSSNWSSDLYIVDKKNGEIHPCRRHVPHTRVHLSTPWLHQLLAHRPGQGISLDFSAARRHPEDNRPAEYCLDFRALHRWSSAELSFCFTYIDDILTIVFATGGKHFDAVQVQLATLPQPSLSLSLICQFLVFLLLKLRY